MGRIARQKFPAGMKTAQVKIVNKRGMHARAAAKLVQLSHQFTSSIRLKKDEEEADAKSITDILMLSGAQDTVLTVSVEGSDEEHAMEEVRRLINEKFGEEE
jgi:phosphocarrier protein